MGNPIEPHAYGLPVVNNVIHSMWHRLFIFATGTRRHAAALGTAKVKNITEAATASAITPYASDDSEGGV